MPLDAACVRYLEGQTRGRLSTVAADGSPQNKPVGFEYNAALGTIDISGFEMERSAKYRNVRINPMVALVVDDAIGEGAAGMRFLEIRGRAEQVTAAATAPTEGLGSHLIRIHPRRLVSSNLDDDHPGMQTQDIEAAGSSAPAPGRPALAIGAAVAREAERAAASFVAELQAGWDTHDADVSNRHFAADIVWGSPFGATVHSYEDLHAIHLRLKQVHRGGTASRYEIVKVLAPAPGVALAQVRRVALDDRGQPVEISDDTSTAFSEMVLYVLVRRDGGWWLAAGQNTLIRPAPSN